MNSEQPLHHPIKGINPLLDHIKQRIRQGESKKSILAALKPFYPNPAQLARTIAMFPTESDRERYRYINLAVAGLFLITNLSGWFFVILTFNDLGIIDKLFNGLALLIQLVFLFGAFHFHGNSYPFMTQLSLIRLWSLFPGFNGLQAADWLLNGLLLLNGACLVGGAFIWFKVFPYYGLSGPRKDDNGEIRVS